MSWKWNQWFICIVSVLQEALQTSERKRVAEQTKFTPLWKLRQGPPKDWHLPLNHGKPEDSWTAIINLLWPKQSEMKTLIFLSLIDLVKLFRATCWRDCSSFISIPIFFFLFSELLHENTWQQHPVVNNEDDSVFSTT